MVTIGSTLATPGRISPTCRPVDLIGVLPDGFALLDKGQLLLVSKDSLGAVDNQQHQADSHQDEPDS